MGKKLTVRVSPLTFRFTLLLDLLRLKMKSLVVLCPPCPGAVTSALVDRFPL